jgi:hypothetical protein
VYVARYGWNGRSGGLLIGAAVFVLIAVTVPMSLALRVVTLVLFGGGGALVFIASIATRRVALRVDASGITLGGSPGRYRSTTCLIPWAEVREVVLWRQPMPYGRSMRYVAVARHSGAPPLAGRRGRRAARVAARALTPVSGDMLLASRAANLWRLDTDRMTAAAPAGGGRRVRNMSPGANERDQERWAAGCRLWRPSAAGRREGRRELMGLTRRWPGTARRCCWPGVWANCHAFPGEAVPRCPGGRACALVACSSGTDAAERTAAGAPGLAQQRGGDQVVGAGAVAGDRDVPHHRDPDQRLDI